MNFSIFLDFKFVEVWVLSDCPGFGYTMWVFWKVGSLMWVKILKIFMKKWLFPNRSRINLGWFLDHQGIKKHQFECIGSFRNHQKHQKIKKSDKLKNWSRKWRDTIARSWFRFLLGSFGFNSLSFWLYMTLRADMLKSNYLTCSIFEISSVPILVPFSI